MTEDLPLTAEDVAEIVAILESSGYREVDIATSRFRLRVARGDGAESGFTQEWQWAGATGGGETGPGDAGVGEAAETASDPDATCAAARHVLPCAATGRATVRPAGRQLDAETVVGIVETMKLMNPVHAGRGGIVSEVIVPNATMVAKGQALVRLT